MHGDACSSCGHSLRTRCAVTIHIKLPTYSMVDCICHGCDNMLREACRHVGWTVDPRAEHFVCDCWLEELKEFEDA